jgi:hypothetical protein
MERLVGMAASLYPNLGNQMQVFSRLTEWLTASRYPDLGSGLGEAPADVAELLALIKVFRIRVGSLAPFAV